MADSFPAPLVPEDCDLRDFPYMPMDIVRLFGSRFHAVASDAEWRAGVTLWLKSFHQFPAASIPDDDVELCRLAELGRDHKTWKKLRKGALHGWVKCSDGRFYHPVVAEKANEAWISKLQRRWGSDCARIKKNNQRHGTNTPCPSFEDWLSRRKSAAVREDTGDLSLGADVDVPKDTSDCPQGQYGDVPGDTPDLSPPCPDENGSKGKGKGKGEGEGIIDSSSLRSDRAPTSRDFNALNEAVLSRVIVPVTAALAEAVPRKKAEPRGTRLSPDWRPREAEVELARALGVDLEMAAAEFRDYWVSRVKDALKLDWDRTFANRLRELADQGKFRARTQSRDQHTGREVSQLSGALF